MRIAKTLMICMFLGTTAPVLFAGAEPAKTKTDTAKKCEHGVKKTLCSRCNPKLKAVYKSKGDWCEEHDRAESQCAICHPNLAKEGVKP